MTRQYTDQNSPLYCMYPNQMSLLFVHGLCVDLHELFITYCHMACGYRIEIVYFISSTTDNDFPLSLWEANRLYHDDDCLSMWIHRRQLGVIPSQFTGDEAWPNQSERNNDRHYWSPMGNSPVPWEDNDSLTRIFIALVLMTGWCVAVSQVSKMYKNPSPNPGCYDVESVV